MNAKGMETELDVDTIVVGPRLRAVDPAHVELLAASIRERGQIGPIQVGGPDELGRYTLIAGAHRLAAIQLLGLPTIKATIREGLSDREARLIEIEENLVRHDLSELDRAVFLDEWKRLYTAAAAPRRRGRPRNDENRQKTGEFSLPFAQAVRERLRLSPSSINAAVRRATISSEVRATIAGTWLADHGGQLDQLARLSPTRQMDVVRLILRGEPKARNVTAALAQIHGETVAVKSPDERQYEALIAAWRRACVAARDDFIAFLTKVGSLPSASTSAVEEEG